MSKELRQGGFSATRLTRNSTTDASGRYHFRVGPGRYLLWSISAGGTPRQTVEVKNEAEIIRDIPLHGPARETYVTGVVIEKTPAGDRPVPRAIVRRLKIGQDGSYNHSQADEHGRFRIIQAPGEWMLYAASPTNSLAGFMPFPTSTDPIALVISKAPTITGRVIDSDGRPQAAWIVEWRIDTDSRFGDAGHMASITKTDEQGRFKLRMAPVGSQGEFTVYHQRKPTATTPRTVAWFRVTDPDPDPIMIPDLVIPAEKPTK